MQDYALSGFAPAMSDRFALNSSKGLTPARDLPLQMLLRQPVAIAPTTRGAVILQQERKIRNEFLAKTNTFSKNSRPSGKSGGAGSQRKNVSASHETSGRRLKLVASAIVVSFVLFAAQIGCSFVSKQLTTQGVRQYSRTRTDLIKNFDSTTASAKNATANGVATSGALNGNSSSAGYSSAGYSSTNSFDQTRSIDELIAIAHQKAAAMEKARIAQNYSAQTSEVIAPDFSATSTVDLIKSGYEKLCGGSAQESVALLTEAVKRDGNDPNSRRYLGYALLKAGKPTEALKQYDALEKLNGLQQNDRLAMRHAEFLVQSASKSNQLGNNELCANRG